MAGSSRPKNNINDNPSKPALEMQYYVTICTQNREYVFGDILNNEMILNKYGDIARNSWLDLPSHHENIGLDQFIIMPNHVHVIINIVGAIHESPVIHESSEINDSKNNIDLKRAIRQTRAIRELPLQIRRRNMLLSKMVGYIKMRSAKQINALHNCPGKSVWQRNYHIKLIKYYKYCRNIIRA
ncbi:MAG: hypothetical protein KJ893_06910 [Candidatus Omnitrophica bacterium]|nr:hypothetical protein [Candidatus Omnitrophota bacterium]MBU4478565.1 hypothetical protein [Candidatus Omnitrophota bacterium]MCG2703564.1 hypothetical protein [Candidatus Omnitrophota bacterium]